MANLYKEIMQVNVFTKTSFNHHAFVKSLEYIHLKYHKSH